MYAVMVIFDRRAVSITGLEDSMWQLIASFITVAVFLGLKQEFSVKLDGETWRPFCSWAS
jgi:hypothetical protein